MSHRRLPLLALALLPLSSACGKGGGGAAAAAKSIDVTPVNAAVPATLKDKLVFEARPIDESMGRHKESPKVAAPVPRDWTADDIIPGQFKPPGADKFDANHFGASTTCQGECKGRSAAEWKAVSDKDLFAQFSGGSLKVAKDENLPDGRVVVATGSGMGDETVYIALARWHDGASHTMWCTAQLGGDWKAAAEAFEQACRAAQVASWD